MLSNHHDIVVDVSRGRHLKLHAWRRFFTFRGISLVAIALQLVLFSSTVSHTYDRADIQRADYFDKAPLAFNGTVGTTRITYPPASPQ